MYWVSQYNNKFSRKSLGKLITFVRKNQDEGVFNKIEIFDTIPSGYDNIHDVYDTIKIFIRGYSHFETFNPRVYLWDFRYSRNALDFFTKQKNHYSTPISIWNSLLDHTEELLALTEKEKDNVVKEMKIRYSDKILEEVYNILSFYIVKLIDGEVLKDF